MSAALGEVHPASGGPCWTPPLGRLINQIEQAKARIRAKVEHPFRVIERQFGYLKTRYRGLAKNRAQIVTLFALTNLFQARRRLMLAGEVCP